MREASNGVTKTVTDAGLSVTDPRDALGAPIHLGTWLVLSGSAAPLLARVAGVGVGLEVEYWSWTSRAWLRTTVAPGLCVVMPISGVPVGLRETLPERI
jgi:hypothetical protein